MRLQALIRQPIQAAPTVHVVDLLAGDNQTQAVGGDVAILPSIQVVDGSGAAVVGQAVTATATYTNRVGGQDMVDLQRRTAPIGLAPAGSWRSDKLTAVTRSGDFDIGVGVVNTPTGAIPICNRCAVANGETKILDFGQIVLYDSDLFYVVNGAVNAQTLVTFVWEEVPATIEAQAAQG